MPPDDAAGQHPAHRHWPRACNPPGFHTGMRYHLPPWCGSPFSWNHTLALVPGQPRTQQLQQKPPKQNDQTSSPDAMTTLPILSVRESGLQYPRCSLHSLSALPMSGHDCPADCFPIRFLVFGSSHVGDARLLPPPLYPFENRDPTECFSKVQSCMKRHNPFHTRLRSSEPKLDSVLSISKFVY